MQRIALVTGGSKGIGFAIAHELAQRGVSDIVLLARTETDLATAKGLLEKTNATIRTISADVSRWEEVKRARELFEQWYARLDILVNNAGTFAVIDQTQMNDVDRQRMHDISTVVAYGPCAISSEFFNLLLRSNDPKQFDTLSSAAARIFPGNTPYGPAKRAQAFASLATTINSAGRIKTYRLYSSNVDTDMRKGADVPMLRAEFVARVAANMILENSATDTYIEQQANGTQTLVEETIQYTRPDGSFNALAVELQYLAVLQQRLTPAAYGKFPKHPIS